MPGRITAPDDADEIEVVVGCARRRATVHKCDRKARLMNVWQALARITGAMYSGN
jgi:hypothetical protein